MAKWLGSVAILLIALLVVGLSHRQSPQNLDIVIPKRIELGSFSPDQIKNFTFSIRSNSSKEAGLERLTPSCGCTTVTVSASVLKPRQSLDIHFSVKARHNLYEINEGIQVWIKGINHPFATINLVGKVEAPYLVRPGELNYGVMDFKALPQTVRFNLYSGSNSPVPDDIVASSIPNEVEVVNSVRMSDGSLAMDAVLKRAPIFGEITGTLLLKSKAYAEPISVKYSAKIVGDLSARPSMLIFNLEKRHRGIGKEVIVSGGNCREMTWALEPSYLSNLFKIEVVDDSRLMITALENVQPSNQVFDAVLFGKSSGDKTLSLPIHYECILE